MKKIIAVIALFLITTGLRSQILIDKTCDGLSGRTDIRSFSDTGSLEITFSANSKTNLTKFLKQSKLTPSAHASIYDIAANKLTEEKGTPTQPETEFKAGDESFPAGTFFLKMDFADQLKEDADTSKLTFNCNGDKTDTIILVRKKAEATTPPKTPPPATPHSAVEFISPAMMQAIRNLVSCSFCEKTQSLDQKSDRKFSTDYVVLYDPMLKGDAFTICKHRIKKDKGAKPPGKKYVEFYQKVKPRMFAPRVGSQIRFEVINLPLTESIRITAAEADLFNTGSAQFQSIINSQVTANIVNRLTAGASGSEGNGAKGPGGTTQQSSELRQPTDEEKLAVLQAQLLDYVSAFRLSSCTIDNHYQNLPSIIMNINKNFSIAANESVSAMAALRNKFAGKEASLKIVEQIGTMLTLLKDLKPIAYTTLRAKNRDYITIKTFDANNNELIPEKNIRMSGGLKIDFSAGLVLTGLSDFNYILKDTSLKYRRDPAVDELTDTSGNMIIRENTGKRQMGVSIMTHIYPRISSNYNIGATVGLMSSTELDLRLMLGGSVMLSSIFGSNNRVSFSGGVVWGKVKRLSQGYYEGYKEINDKPLFYPATTTINTVRTDVTEHSWFFAVTMNFGGN